MFIIRWFLILNSIIPALILFPIKKIYLRKDKKQKYKGPKIIAMNHTAFLDYLEALLAFPGRRKYVLVGAQFYAFNPFLTFLLKAMGVIRVDEVTGNMDAVNKAVEVLNKGHDILIFPEGHIETEGKLLEYKQAAALISLSSGCPIVPVFHNGRIGPGKRDLVFVGSYMYPDTYICREGLETLQDRAQAFTKELQERTEVYRQFYLRNFMIADGEKLKRPKYAGFLYNFMKYGYQAPHEDQDHLRRRSCTRYEIYGQGHGDRCQPLMVDRFRFALLCFQKSLLQKPCSKGCC